MTCYRGTPVCGEAPEIGLSFASPAEFVHLRRCRTSHKALSPRNKWLVGRLRRLRRFSLATLWNMCCGCVASAWLMGLTAEAKQAGLRYLAVPPAPPGTRPRCLRTMDLYWLLWLCHLLDHEPRCSPPSSSSRPPLAARSEVIDFQQRNNPPSFPGENTDALRLLGE